MILNRTVGNLVLPTTDTDASTLAALEPGLDILVDLLKTAINNDLEPAWTDAALGTPLEGRAPVQTALPFEPTLPLMREVKVDFPALFVFPLEDPTVEKHTMRIDRITQRWGIDYILGPLKLEDYRKIGGSLRVVQKLVMAICKIGGHPAYAMDDNDVQAQQVLIGEGAGTCGFERFRFVSATPPGQASFGEGQPTYWATRITCEGAELCERTAAIGVVHTGGRFYMGTGTGVPEDDGTGEDDNGIIEEQIQATTSV